MTRVKDDDELRNRFTGGRVEIDRPVLIVHTVESGRNEFILNFSELDPMLDKAYAWGILLSDILDHAAAAYVGHGHRSERDVRDRIMRALKKENQLKEDDPTRGGQTGATLRPKAN